MELDSVSLTVDSHVALITLEKSESGNRINQPFLRDMLAAIQSAMKNTDARTIILRSNGRTFCHGMDLDALCKDVESLPEFVKLYCDVLMAIQSGEKPVICLVDGEVRAGGVGLACCCDLLYATPHASFALTESLFGLIPANVLPFIVGYRISPQKARYLVFTAKTISADEAKQIGLVDEITERDKMDRSIRAVMKNLLRSEPAALGEMKRFTQDMVLNQAALTREAAQKKLAELTQSPKVLEGIAGFQEGIVPKWFEKYRPTTGTLLAEEP